MPGKRNQLQSVLVIEDNDDSRDIFSSVLEHAGYAVMQAANGREALEMLKEVVPSAIVLDLRMPEMDGATFRRHLAADRRLQDIPVLIVSAHPKEATHMTDTYMQKPIDLGELVEMLPRLVG